VESLREKLIEIIKTLPEDKLQFVLDFLNRMNQYPSEEGDYDELLMGEKQQPDRFC